MDLKVGDKVMLIGYNGIILNKPDNVTDIEWFKNTHAIIRQIITDDVPVVGGKIIININQSELLINRNDIVYMDEFFEDI